MSFLALKTVALLSMLWDHATFVWPLDLPFAADYIGRIAQYLMLLCLLYYVAYRVKKKNHLVE